MVVASKDGYRFLFVSEKMTPSQACRLLNGDVLNKRKRFKVASNRVYTLTLFAYMQSLGWQI